MVGHNKIFGGTRSETDGGAKTRKGLILLGYHCANRLARKFELTRGGDKKEKI
jgi:hypothetical protein